MSKWKYVKVERGGRWVTLTLNRPQVLNALNQELLQELGEIFDWIASVMEIHVVIVRGAGEKAFAAGADIAQFVDLQTDAEARQLSRLGQNVFQQIENLHKPVIMAVNGYALGGGCELALAGDIVLAAEHARFGQPEVNLGIIPGYGGTVRLSRAIGISRALQLCMTGDPFTAQEAKEWGWVWRVLPFDQLFAEAENLAKQLSNQPAQALAQLKKTIRQGYELPLAEALELESKAFGTVWETTDRKEGISAFLEKRKPLFRGK
ncbi:enoyl-CoA hydratase/3-hydroxypropionyl-coenzyme A dehydratase [Seinonella peptonophila]|uniref:Enoyl-CoA hydratase/3-hydroxypropionyl-coenzyme A dehydratase n=1 Tax=Seinonella peptonophila TaxID=112248 RepID=A0A1M4XRJ3_9BACL|nr:enoyl-CoA hydratase/isomerase family protein [Seinonella peptonophila]SHE95893.1 enoyl-CoA hydratase/3-hydroxypropionyl-coenzyme A dehydratase [Seinonella peptonophila]